MRIAIIGGGITGLSAAWLLSDQHVVHLFEREEELGGRSRTFHSGLWKFDYSGHWLWGGSRQAHKFVREFVSLSKIQKQAAAHVRGVFVPFPLQNNLGRVVVDPAERTMFAEGLFKAQIGEARTLQDRLMLYGKPTYDLFLNQFDRRYRRYPLDTIPVSGLRRTPEAEMIRVLRGLFAPSQTPEIEGYNKSFLVVDSGVGALPEAICQALNHRHVSRKPSLFLGQSIDDVGILCGDYDLVINTAPLLWLFDQLDIPMPELRPLTAYCLNVGGMTNVPEHLHWVYLDEEFEPAVRIGFYSHGYPEGLYAPVKKCADYHAASMYIDVTRIPEPMALELVGCTPPTAHEILAPFLQKGWIKDVKVMELIEMPYGYSIDGFVGVTDLTLFEYARVVSDTLRQHGIISIGEAGKWQGLRGIMECIGDAIALKEELA